MSDRSHARVLILAVLVMSLVVTLAARSFSLQVAGAGRISFGPIWQKELTARSNELLARWR